jgi:uroporphyrinogen-III synthase
MASIVYRRGLQALVTRPREAAETLAAALAARNVGALIEPLIEIHFHAAMPDLTGVQAVLCTSANGVRALARAGGDRGLPLLAVGDATAACAFAEGFTSVASAGGNVADLVRLAVDRLDPSEGRLLYVCGDAVAGDPAGELRKHGFTVERSILYEAQPIGALSPAATDAMRSAAIDFALFFSPRTAAIFARLANDAGLASCCETITVLSISPAADAALDALPWRERCIARKPEQTALLVALDQLLAEQPTA